MKILITGTGGLIGHQTILTLYNEGHQVTGSYRSVPPKNTYPWPCVSADLLKKNATEVLLPLKPEVLIHCAAVLPKTFEKDSSAQSAKANRTIDDNILELVSQTSSKLVYLSSASIYGLTGAPWKENSDLSPQTEYSRAKLETEEKIIKSKIPHVIFRISSPYGFRQENNNVLKLFIENAMHNKPLYYYGSGNREQDFVAVEDVALAIKKAMTLSEASGIFNIGSGAPISMKNLAELIVKCVPGTQSQILPAKQADPQEGYKFFLNIDKTKRLLMWVPGITLENGAKQWVKSLTEKRETSL